MHDGPPLWTPTNTLGPPLACPAPWRLGSSPPNMVELRQWSGQNLTDHLLNSNTGIDLTMILLSGFLPVHEPRLRPPSIWRIHVHIFRRGARRGSFALCFPHRRSRLLQRAPAGYPRRPIPPGPAATTSPRGRRVPPSHHVGEGLRRPAPRRAGRRRRRRPASVPACRLRFLLAAASARWSRPSGPTAGAAGAPLLQAAPCLII